MKTLLFTIGTILLSFNSYAQHMHTSSKMVHLDDVTISTSSQLSNTAAVFSIVKEINAIDEFDYHRFAKESGKSTTDFSLGTEVYSKKVVLRMLRRAARKADNKTEFKNELDEQHLLLTINLENKQLAKLYEQLNPESLDEYLDTWVSVQFLGY
ncbi:hypothetical protein [Nonlabens ponticola]|uniref:Uncharacterized protein n=1 Tax=Nonlabens ponticola TaxID=2496866 RepID=A0A3S9MY90_9FLAO|nr:hypothetical protein [Nonlabens ponticola]AZQ44160.1 hypothetical protein EJ995_07920 [Nonlabens ponticola]